MAVIEGGTSAALMGVGSETGSAGHTTAKPVPYGALGHYLTTAVTGTIAAGAGADSEILQFRWTDTTRLAVIQEVSILSMHSLTGFTAGFGQFDLTIARSYSAAGTGGATLTLTGDNNSLRTSMGASLVGEIRVATTAALTAGTKTFDANRIGYARFQIDATANKVQLGASGASATAGNAVQRVPLFLCDVASGEHPIVLSSNEGFAIRATVPATGTWVTYMLIKWAEATAY